MNSMFSPLGPLRWRLVVALPLLLGLALRLNRLGDQGVWWDEGFSVWVARHSFVDITAVAARDTSPPLYYWLVHFWLTLTGDGEFAARYLSVMFGVLAIAATYTLGSAILGPATGWLGATLLAASRFHIWWSQEIRMYAPAVVLGALSTYLMVRIVSRPQCPQTRKLRTRPRTPRDKDTRDAHGWRLAAAYVLVTALALGTHYLLLLLVLVQNAFVAGLLLGSHRQRRGLLATWTGSQVIVGLLFAPWAWSALGKATSWSAAEPFDAGLFARVYWTVLSLGVSSNVERYTLLAGAVLLVTGMGLPSMFWGERQVTGTSHSLAATSVDENALGQRLDSGPLASIFDLRRNDRAEQASGILRGVALLAMMVLAFPVGTYLLSLPRSMLYTPPVEVRYVVIVAPFGCLLFAASSRALWRANNLLGTAALLTLAFAFVAVLPDYYEQRHLQDEYQTALEYVASVAHPGDSVMLYPDTDWPVFAYHLHDRLSWTGFPNGQQPNIEAMEHFVQPALDKSGRLWVVQTPRALSTDPQQAMERWLGGRAALVDELRVRDKVVRLYSSKDTVAQELPAEGATEASLTRSYRAVSKARPGDVVYILTYWNRSPDRLEIRLTGRSGATAFTRAFDPVPKPTPSADGVVVPLRFAISNNLQPGEYQLTIAASGSAASFSIGELTILPAPRAQPAEEPPNRVEATFGGKIKLLGYGIAGAGDGGSLRAGNELRVTLYWQALDEVEESYKVFVHLLGSSVNAKTANRLWGQSDSEPDVGTSPTAGWSQGDRIADQHTFATDASTPAGWYEIEVGLYDPATGQRLKTDQADDRVIVARLMVGE